MEREMYPTRTILTLLLLSFSVAANAELKGYIVYKSPMATAQGFHVASVDGLRVMSSEAQRVAPLAHGAGATKLANLNVIGGASFKLRSTKVARLAQRLQLRGFAVESDSKIHTTKVPNDTYYAGSQQDLVAIGAPAAWDISTDSTPVIVGVIDTGIDSTHPDLAANIWRDPATGAFGKNFITASAQPIDDAGHGTHVAGIIGAVGNNSVGISGTAWKVKMMALKALDSKGSGTWAGVLAAIDYAVTVRVQQKLNLRVINASLGGSGYSAAMQQAITAAYDAGILFVASAGNQASDNGIVPSYPASYANVLAVAATDNAGALASFSNYSGSVVQIAAPGVSIFSTYPVSLAKGSPPYVTMSGTSMAAPRVAGAAALILGADSTLTAAQLRARLLSNARALPALSGKVSTGLLNVANAVVVNAPVTATPTATSTSTPIATSTATPTATPTSTRTSTPTASSTPTKAPTLIPSPVPTKTATPIPTKTATPTATRIPTVSGSRINGSIVINGAPGVGMTVTASPGGSAITNSGGSFTLSGLTRGKRVTLTFSKPGLSIPARIEIPISSEVINLKIEMRISGGSGIRSADTRVVQRVRVRRIK